MSILDKKKYWFQFRKKGKQTYADYTIGNSIQQVEKNLLAWNKELRKEHGIYILFDILEVREVVEEEV